MKLSLTTRRVDVDSRDSRSRTLTEAASEGHKVVVKVLLVTGIVNVGLKDRYGGTPLSPVALTGHEAVP